MQRPAKEVRMAATEDEVAKKQVQEAIWVWTGRILVLLATFGFGVFSGWVMWGSGTEGAPALRETKTQLEAQVRDLRNKRLTVAQGRLEQCQRDLTKARSGG
jgi:hypothetical protein